MNTIIDTDALLGIFNAKDAHHREATRIVRELMKRKVHIFVLPTTLGEFASLLAKRLGIKNAQEALDDIIDSDMSILEIPKDITLQAITTYQKQGSRHETLCDCLIMATARILGITHIFSFDQGYKKKINGFWLIPDLL